MDLQGSIQQLAKNRGATLSEKKGTYIFQLLVAERKAFLSRKRLEYIAKFRIDDGAREIRFTEMLKESGSGFSSGGDPDGMSAGFGFKAGVYKSGMGGLEGTIEEQSRLFGKTYAYKFDLGAIRAEFEAAAKSAGYALRYQVTPLGL